MANCSIPNSTPATGRTSTTSSRRSRRLNSTTPLGEAISLTAVTELSIRKVFNAQRSRFNAQRSIQTVGRWTLDACSRFIGVGRSTFSFYGRVKGAWWPSRSSKPWSPCKRRGRFDSYPLRSFPAVPVAVSLCETRTSPTGRRLQRSLVKGGESDVT
jgi:hypothetical protein